MICILSLAKWVLGCVNFHALHNRQSAKPRRHDFHYLKKPGDVDVQEYRNPTEDDQHEADRGWQQRSCHSYVVVALSFDLSICHFCS